MPPALALATGCPVTTRSAFGVTVVTSNEVGVKLDVKALPAPTKCLVAKSPVEDANVITGTDVPRGGTKPLMT